MACGSVASESRVSMPQITFSPTGRSSVRLSHRPEGGVPRGKKSVATPQGPPPEDTKARSSCSEEPPDWLSTFGLSKSCLGFDSLIYFPFLLLLQVAIHSLQLSSLASLLLWYFQSWFTLSFSLGKSWKLTLFCLLLQSTPFNLCDSFLHHGSFCIGT